MTETCGTCRFSVPDAEPWTRCRRHPPIDVNRGPTVNVGDWCGEYEPRGTKVKVSVLPAPDLTGVTPTTLWSSQMLAPWFDALEPGGSFEIVTDKISRLNARCQVFTSQNYPDKAFGYKAGKDGKFYIVRKF